MARVYIGKLSDRAREKDVEHFFRGYGKIRDIYLKNGFGFIEFDDRRDAEDAIDDLSGKELVDSRVILELAKRDPRSSDSWGFRDRGRGRSPPRRGLRYSPPRNTKYRLIVSNLTTRWSWQDLKDLFRDGGYHITFADAHRSRSNEGVVCFSNEEEMLRAKEKYDGHEANGRALKLTVDDGQGRRSRSRSPRRSRSKSGSRGRSRSRDKSRSKSKSKSRSRSKSKSKSRSKSKSKSRSPSKSPDMTKKEDDQSRSASPEGKDGDD